MLDPAAIAPETLRRFTRAEYDHFGDLGVFDDERVELLCGAVVTMSPNSPEHIDPIAQLQELLFEALKGRAKVRVQFALLAGDESVPEPDIAVVPLDDYRHRHPAEALLVVEVALSSLRIDRLVKAPLYAASGFPEYWIVNVADRCIEVYRTPQGGAYADLTRHGAGETLSPQAFPDVAIRVNDVLR